MGRWFTNLNLRGAAFEQVGEQLRQILGSNGFSVCADADEADCGVAILTYPGSEWVTVCGDDDIDGYAAQLSGALDVDVICTRCLDSDYLCLNLINAGKNLDIWAAVGSAAGYGIKRRTTAARWKSHVADHDAFCAALKQKYDFAEDALEPLSEGVGIDFRQLDAEFELLDMPGQEAFVERIFFSKPVGMKAEPSALRASETDSIYSPDCLGKTMTATFESVGGPSKGLRIWFVSDSAGAENLRFEAVARRHTDGDIELEPLYLKKRRFHDGRKAYCAELPAYRILEKPSEALGELKQFRENMRRSVNVRFTPFGPREHCAEFCLIAEPMKNPAGSAEWTLWKRFVSRKEDYPAYYSRFCRDDVRICDLAPIIVEMLPSQDLRNAVSNSRHVFSTDDLTAIVMRYSRDLWVRCELLKELGTDTALRLRETEMEKYRDFVQHSDDTVFELSIKDDPAAYEETFICDSYAAAVSAIHKYHRRWGRPLHAMGRYEIVKRRLIDTGCETDDDWLGEIRLLYDYTPVSITANGYDDRFDHEVMYPNFLNAGDLVSYVGLDGERGLGIVYDQPGVLSSQCVVVPLDSPRVHYRDYEMLTFAHDHAALPDIEKLDPASLPDETRIDYEACRDYLLNR